MGTEGYVDDTMTMSEYLAQLLKDKKQLQAFPNAFVHLERILDEEIRRIRGNVFCMSGSEPLHLPEPLGPIVTLCEKLTVPTKEFPDFNFIGRLLGPRGMTAKQLELDTGCKILIRGQGSMRDKRKEEQMKGKPKWEHLDEELHVLVTVEDSKNRATVKLRRAIEEIKRLIVPVPECDDELKKRQLIELAILNGTYRGLNGIFVSAAAAAAAAAGTSAFGPNFLAPQLAMGPHFAMGPHLSLGQHLPLGLPIKSPEQAAGAPILLAPPPVTMFTGALTPLPSPGPLTPVTPIQSPGLMGTSAPLFIHGDGGMLYQLDQCIMPPQSSPPYDYSFSTVTSPSIGFSMGR